MKRNKSMKWLYAFLAFMLVISAVPVGVVSAESEDTNTDSTEDTQTNDPENQNPKLVTPHNLEEKSIKGDGAELILILENGEWNSFNYYNNKALLIDSIEPVNQKEAWNSIKNSLKDNSDFIVDKNMLTVKIKLSDTEKDKYYLKEDQQLKIKVPKKLLKGTESDNSTLPEVTFTIHAQPKVLVSGTATPSISYDDLITGGKTIELTLVNASWNEKASTNEILSMFNWKELSEEDIEQQILESAKVRLMKENLITIVLPELSPFKLKVDNNGEFINLTLDPATTNNNDNLTDPKLDNGILTIFKVKPLDKVTAKVTAQKEISEFDVIKGFEATVTLSNDKWNNNLETIINENVNIFNDDLVVHSFEKLSETQLKIIFKASSNYDIKENTDYNLIIDNKLLTISSSNIPIEKAFTVKAVTANYSGTAGSNIDAVTLEKGGKTLIFTLTNAKFFENVNKEVISDIIIENDTLGSLFKEALKTSEITAKGNKLTIKLPKINATENGSISFKIPKALIDHEGASDVDDVGTLTVGAKASASISTTSLTEAQVKNSNDSTNITIELSGADWNSNIESNKTMQNALLKGFTVDDQADAWKKVIEAFKYGGTFKITKDNDKSILNIKLPTNINYSIVRDQIVSLKVPKSVLENYKYDIESTNKLTITYPEIKTNKGTFLTFLPELSSVNDIENYRVSVPKKVLETMQVTNIAVPDSGNITTLVVKTSDNTDVTATISNTVKNKEDGTTSKTEVTQNKTGKETMFIFTNVDPKSEVTISVKLNNKIVAEKTEKVGKGKKTYSYLPKKTLEGTYSLSSLLSDEKLLKEIFKYYGLDELEVGTTN